MEQNYIYILILDTNEGKHIQEAYKTRKTAEKAANEKQKQHPKTNYRVKQIPIY